MKVVAVALFVVVFVAALLRTLYPAQEAIYTQELSYAD